jgi:Na+-driven multidrug efflux pump
VQDLTRQLLIIAGLSLPIHSFAHVTYFTIRSGGRTVITFFFDAVYTWLVTVVLAFVLTRYTDWDIVRIYLFVQFIDIVKVFIGLLMLKSDFWARNVVND